LGAALTYARRYALFTLVGIASEDDLDAPDLQATPSGQEAPANQAPVPERPRGTGNGPFHREHIVPRPNGHHGGAQAGSRRERRGSNGVWAIPNSAKILGPDESLALRDRLLAELAELGSGDEAATWAQRSLGEKNKLTDKDVRNVEAAFQTKLTSVEAHTGEASINRNGGGEAQGGQGIATLVDKDPDVAKKPAQKRAGAERRKATQETKGIDKSVLALPEPRRIRDREHIKHVATQPCLVCGRTPCDAHHLRFTQSRALGRKVSDEFTVALCRGHHREVHRCGNEAGWWGKLGIDPTITARALWLESHPLPFGQHQADREHADIDADDARANLLSDPQKTFHFNWQ
jgi:hypothetical protein